MDQPKSPLFVWTEEYSVHVRNIDEQHRTLIGYMNDWYDHANRDEVDRARDSLEALARYAAIHFQLEERLLREHGYDGLDEHAAAHVKLLAVLERLVVRYAELPDPDRVGRVAKFLRTWLSNHILDMDKRYAPFLGEHGVK